VSNSTIFTKQLETSCKFTGVAWASILTQTDTKTEWGIQVAHGLKNNQKEALITFLKSEKKLRWLNLVALGKKVSSRSLEEKDGQLNCQRIFAFPTNLEKSVLLVGADRLSKIKKDLFRVLAMGVSDELQEMTPNTRIPLYQSGVETNKCADYLTQIYEIICQIIGVHERSKIADISAKLIAERFGHEMVLVMLLDDSLQELVAEGVAGSGTEGVPKGFRFDKNLGIPGEVLETGESMLISDAMDARNYYPVPGWDPGSAMCAPLRDDEVVFGVINVEYRTPNFIDKTDLFLLETLANVLSSIFVNAQEYQQLHSNFEQLEAVRETALDLGKDLDLGILMKRVVNRVRDLVDARGAELGLVDEKEKLVRVLVSENPWQDYTGYSFPLMSGVAGRIAALGEPLAVADFNSWSGKSESSFRAPFTTVAGVPLKLSGEVIGTLSVQDDRPTRAFDNEDIQILELLAPQLSIFIRNARLYQELEETLVAQRLAEERLIRSAKMAAIGEMAAAIAHELNNPLTTVTGFTELILEGMSEDSPEYEDLSLVLKEAQRSRSVVRRLLDFSRQGEILHVESDINEIISTVLALVHHIAQTSDTDIRVEMWDDLPKISIDRNQIQQVFLNLIHNGIQAMPNGGDLHIHTLLDQREDGDWVGVVIKDSGEGIREENLDRIFEPFFTTKPSGEGTGLGLSVSYNIVSEHGGYIDVNSKEGEGAEFSVWLPVSGSVG